jgi:hypothetical protein
MIAEMIGQQYNPYQGYPTKQVSDQAWDVYGPTPEYLLPQIHNIQNPDAGGFDLDAFFAAQPGLRGPLAEAYTQAEGDPIELYNYLQSNEPTETKNRKGETVQRPGFQDRLRQEVGATEWADLAEQGNPDIIRAFNKGASPEELDEIALDQYMQGLEGVLAAGSPTTQRAMGEFDYTRQREGFRPAPGTGQEYPQFQGAGFGGGGGGGDALSSLAQSPQYGAPQVVREDEGGVWVRTPGASDFSGPGRRVAQQIRRGQYGGVSRGSRRQDANGGGQSRRRSGSGDYGSPSGFYRRASKLNPFNWF